MLERALNELKNPKSNTNTLQIAGNFIGADGSMGFSNGARYELIVQYNRGRGVFEARTADGKLYCPYQSAEAFAKNWTAAAIRKGV